MDMADPDKTTRHIGMSVKLQRSFFAAQKDTLKYMFGKIVDKVLAQCWPDDYLDELRDMTLPDMNILFWY